MAKPLQATFLDPCLEKIPCFSVYHDQSGTDRAHARFLLHGALIVPDSKLDRATEILQYARQGHQNRIHFVNLRDNTRSPRVKVAREWVRAFFAELLDFCFYKCMVIDQGSPGFKASLDARWHHLYNWAAMLAVHGGVSWSLAHYHKVQLSIYSEEMSRAPDDNFVDYLPREVERRSTDRGRFPEVSVAGRIILVNGDPMKVVSPMRKHCELIQLTDLITGATAQAINALASQRVKLDLAKMVGDRIEDSRLPPWRQTSGLHRRFSVSCFPDSLGEFYDVELAIATRNQPTLPGL